MEFAELPPSTNTKVNEDLKSRDEVQQFIQFIEEMKVDKTDYTAKKWREILADPDELIGFGKPGDWYQFVQQKCNALSFFDGISNVKSSKKLLQHVELLNIVKSNSGPNPKAFDWFNVTEMFDIDPPKFHERQVTVSFKINTNNGAHVIFHVDSCHWDRYSSEGDKMGPCGKMNVTVVESTVKELQQFNGIIVLRHDATDLTDDDEIPDEPVSLSISFFTKLAKILGVPKTSFVKFVFDTCQYPFTKCDWKNEIEQKKAKHIKKGDQYTKNLQYIKEEIMEKMPNVMQIFEKGYADIDDHIGLLGYLQRFIHWKIRNLHCQEMMVLALSEDRYFDFSSAKDLVSNSAWFTVTDTYSKYSIDVCNAKGNSEFTLLVETTVDADEYDDEDEIINIKISLLNVQNRLKKKIVKIFQPYADDFECEEEKCSIQINEDGVITCSFAHFAKHNAIEQSILLEIMKLMHLNWNHDQFMKFLVEMACLEEDQTSFDYYCASDVTWASEFFIDVAKEREDNPTIESEDYSSESDDDGEDTLMDLDQELNDIKMELDPDILNTHGRHVLRVRNPTEPQMSDSSDESDKFRY